MSFNFQGIVTGMDVQNRLLVIILRRVKHNFGLQWLRWWQMLYHTQRRNYNHTLTRQNLKLWIRLQVRQINRITRRQCPLDFNYLILTALQNCIYFLKCIFTSENSKNVNKTPVFAQIILRFCNYNQGLFSNHFYLVVWLQVFVLLISGQIVTDAMSLGNIHGLSRVIPHITECMALLGNQQNVSVLCSVVNCFASRVFQM